MGSRLSEACRSVVTILEHAVLRAEKIGRDRVEKIDRYISADRIQSYCRVE